MNELKIFENKEFGQVRTVTINEEPWLVGKDVAEALGYERPSDAIKIHVDMDDKLIRCFTDSGQGRNMIVINESGLYALIFGSKLESAKRFKHWVTDGRAKGRGLFIKAVIGRQIEILRAARQVHIKNPCPHLTR